MSASVGHNNKKNLLTYLHIADLHISLRGLFNIHRSEPSQIFGQICMYRGRSVPRRPACHRYIDRHGAVYHRSILAASSRR